MFKNYLIKCKFYLVMNISWRGKVKDKAGGNVVYTVLDMLRYLNMLLNKISQMLEVKN